MGSKRKKPPTIHKPPGTDITRNYAKIDPSSEQTRQSPNAGRRMFLWPEKLNWARSRRLASIWKTLATPGRRLWTPSGTLVTAAAGLRFVFDEDGASDRENSGKAPGKFIGGVAVDAAICLCGKNKVYGSFGERWIKIASFLRIVFGVFFPGPFPNLWVINLGFVFLFYLGYWSLFSCLV